MTGGPVSPALRPIMPVGGVMVIQPALAEEKSILVQSTTSTANQPDD